MEGIASIDLFVVPTIAFQQLYALLVLGHRRRELLWFRYNRQHILQEFAEGALRLNTIK
jgi:hypothetical protein